MQVTPQNYHSPEVKAEYLSNSQWRQWLACPAAAYAEIFQGYVRPKTTALLVGSYVDRALTAPDELEAFIEENKADIFGKKGDKIADFRKADKLIERMQADKVWREIAVAAKKQVVMEGVIAGQKWLYMSDIQIETSGNETILDLKTAADFEDDWTKDATGRNVKINWIDAAGYWRQLALGRELFKQTRGGTIPVCGIVGVKKPATEDRPVGVGLWVLDDADRFDREIARIAGLTDTVMAWKSGQIPPSRCGRCDYCQQTSSLEDELSAPSEREYTM